MNKFIGARAFPNDQRGVSWRTVHHCSPSLYRILQQSGKPTLNVMAKQLLITLLPARVLVQNSSGNVSPNATAPACAPAPAGNATAKVAVPAPAKNASGNETDPEPEPAPAPEPQPAPTPEPEPEPAASCS
eukprot:gnl/MRDRNA2_/MRDRNA2_162601_c0_seq1.p2 gnl/MRDRNA2_/MRDRNA2_162601_c0~~gnl/MRDRNA2_/MRDRNA2_162601_c0_seq1.p2  ORF type:complete len:131 (-),score=26.29 gnl/MRDRNA2_/MRDRNA2_162601_c0_seq1:350-742(-)